MSDTSQELSPIEALAEEYAEVYAEIEKFKAGEFGALLAMEKSMKDTLKKEMDKAALKSLSTKLGVITLQSKKGAVSFDKKKIYELLEKAGVEASSFEKQGAPSLALQVTLKNKPLPTS